MRNLKKILALVLALVMSLSLMATASAAETASASDPYTTAEDVLKDLTVFKGDYGTQDYRFDSNITRTEAAALVYRIATGDVEDLQAQVYTNHPFTDTASVDGWARGYIAYGYNAEIIKGNGDGTFSPNDPVTGYATLAMILRTMGYGRNGEFEGVSWEIQTAATAKQQGLLEGITAADEARLGQPASRALVAQILFNALLQPTAKFSALNPYNYEKDATTLGFQKFGLEEIKGVVTANEYADLEASTPLAAARTRLETKSGPYTLNVTSYFSQIGEENTAYVVPASQSTYKVLCSKLFPSDIFKTDNEYDENTAAGLLKDTGVVLDNKEGSATETKYYTNFEPATKLYANIRLSYYVENTTKVATTYKTFLEGLSSLYVTGDSIRVTRHTDATGNVTGYTRIILANEEVKAEDQAIMKYIFDYANLSGTYLGLDENTVVRGEVYVGTQSKVDVSDTISYEDFKAARMTEEYDRTGKAANGEYIKVIDNDNDGIADYVLKTEYILDDVVNTANGAYYRTIKNGSVKYDTNGGEVYGDTVTPTVGDVFLLTEKIDGKYYAEPAKPVTVTVDTVVYGTPSIKTTDGAEYKESGITNGTAMDEKIAYMDEKISYDLYLDKGGHIRAYNSEVSKYGLLTEMYPTNEFNTAYVTNGNWIVELMGYSDASPVEYNVLNSYGNNNWGQTIENPFIDNSDTRWWTNGVLRRNDYLQEAIAHLGWNRTDAGDNTNPKVLDQGNEFVWNYGNEVKGESWTNVGRYVPGENGVYLYSASELAYSQDTHEQMYYGIAGRTDAASYSRSSHTYRTEWMKAYRQTVPGSTAASAEAAWTAWVADAEEVYAVDYVQLDIKDIRSGDAARLYERADAVDGTEKTVYAVNNTQYYLVTRNENTRNIRTFTGYSNVPNIDAKDIHAIYTVAQNTTANNVNKDYWVSDVIVIELDADYNYESVSLIYNNPSQTINQVRALQTLNSKAEGVKQNLLPASYVWGNQWGDVGYEYMYGFYGLTGTAAAEAENTVSAKITRITDHYNRNGIYAGTVTAIADLSNGGYYIGVDKLAKSGTAVTNDSITVYSGARGSVPVYAIGKNASDYGYNAVELVIDPTKTMAESARLVEGHRIIWVMDGKDVAFIVDLDRSATSWTNASWLGTEWTGIMEEQNPTPGKLEWTVDFEIDGAEVTVGDEVLTANATRVYEDGTELVIEVVLAEGMDTLTVNDEDVTSEMVDGVYTIELTVEKDYEFTIIGTDSGANPDDVIWTIGYADGSLTVWDDGKGNEDSATELEILNATRTTKEGEDLELVPGEDFTSVAGLPLIDEKPARVYVYVGDSEEFVKPETDGSYIIKADAASKSIEILYTDVRDPSDTSEDDSGNTGGNDQNDPGIGDARMPLIRTLSASVVRRPVSDPTEVKTAWYYIEAGSSITMDQLYVKNEDKMNVQGEITEASPAEIEANGTAIAKEKAAEGLTVFYVKYTMKGTALVRPAIGVNEKKDYTEGGKIQAISDNTSVPIIGTYNFYRYGTLTPLSPSLAENILQAAVEKDLGQTVQSVKMKADTAGEATVTLKDGKTMTVKFEEDAATRGSYLLPDSLYAVKVNDVEKGYFPAGASSKKIATGLEENSILIMKGITAVGDVATSVNRTVGGHYAVVDAKGEFTLNLVAPAKGSDVEFVDAVVVDVTFSSAAFQGGSTNLVAAQDKAFTTGVVAPAWLADPSNKVLILEPGIYLKLTEYTATLANQTTAVAVNGEALTGEGAVKKGDGTNPLQFVVNTSDLTPDEDGAIVLSKKTVVQVKLINGENSRTISCAPDELNEIVLQAGEEKLSWLPVQSFEDGGKTTPRIIWTQNTSGPLSAKKGVLDSASKNYLLDISSLSPVANSEGVYEIYAVALLKGLGVTCGGNSIMVAFGGNDMASIANPNSAGWRYIPVGAELRMVVKDANNNLFTTNDDGKKVEIATAALVADIANTVTNPYKVTEDVTFSLKPVVRGLNIKLATNNSGVVDATGSDNVVDIVKAFANDTASVVSNKDLTLAGANLKFTVGTEDVAASSTLSNGIYNLVISNFTDTDLVAGTGCVITEGDTVEILAGSHKIGEGTINWNRSEQTWVITANNVHW